MTSTYLKVALRNMMKHKVFAFINLFGLTIGLATFLLIGLYIFDELTYDRFHSDAASIYRVIETKKSPEGKETKVVSTSFNVSEVSKKTFPEVKDATRFGMVGRTNISTGENTNVFYESYFVGDERFLNVFDFPVVHGDPKTALSKPNTVVITVETALKLFGTTNAVGKTIHADADSLLHSVTAVIRIPGNSHLKFNLLFAEATLRSESSFMEFANKDWKSNSFVTYFKLEDNADEKYLATKLQQLVAANRKDDKSSMSKFALQPLKDIHFYSSDLEGEMDKSGSIVHIYVFALVGLFVLLIACINYMNLTTARFTNRSKEIAVRKVAGASRQNLVKQFLAEACLVTFISLVLSIIIVKLILPAFNQFTEKQLTFGLDADYRLWVGVVVTAIIVGLLAGVYPAIFQASMRPHLLLKNKITLGKGSLSLRRLLVVFQFSVSIIMIVSTIIVYQQMKYVESKDMGFDKQQLVVVDINSGSVRRSAETIKSEFERIPGVKNVSVTSRVPGEWKVIPKVKVNAAGKYTTPGEDVFYMVVDDKFMNTFQVKLLQGRNFSASNLADSSSVILNETAAAMLNIKQPSEQLVEIPSVAFSGNVNQLEQRFRARVIGIVKDFNFQSLKEKVGPMILSYVKNPVHNIDYFTAKVETANVDAALKSMKDVLYSIDPSHLFEYNFLDKQWGKFYREEEKRKTIFFSVAILSIIIACLGLFGLATYAAEQRIKEIGIRKVLGAGVGSIVTLLSKDFLKLVLVAACISFPVAWWAMNNWLEGFAYRISIDWIVFVLAALIALVIALITISLRAIRAATANPVKNLRTE
jgi:putative ABC transport system permease protein